MKLHYELYLEESPTELCKKLMVLELILFKPWYRYRIRILKVFKFFVVLVFGLNVFAEENYESISYNENSFESDHDRVR